MQTVATLLNLACGRQALADDDSQAKRLQIVVGGLLASLVLSSLWGLAAGSSDLALALANVYKLPMIVLLSSLSAVPAGLLAWKLVGARYRSTELLASYSSGILSGTMVLAVLSPLVALYYHSSQWAGPVLALGTVFLALIVASIIFIRGLITRVREQSKIIHYMLPILVVVVMLLATLVQLIAVASPILPELTVFDGGLDRMIQSGGQVVAP